jgi:hypothetical protein
VAHVLGYEGPLVAHRAHSAVPQTFDILWHRNQSASVELTVHDGDMTTSPARRPPTIGFLHTAEANMKTFGDLCAVIAPELSVVHFNEPDLLASAQAAVTPADLDLVRNRTADAVRKLLMRSDVVVCTCSTLGGFSEAVSDAGLVLRSDRPMVAYAVATGARVAVVVAIESTVEPTLALVADEVVRQGRHDVEVASTPCFSAWALWESGDVDGYHRHLGSHVDSLAASGFDTVILAQTSMAGATQYVTGRDGFAVLSSPKTSIQAAIEVMGRAE